MLLQYLDNVVARLDGVKRYGILADCVLEVVDLLRYDVADRGRYYAIYCARARYRDREFNVTAYRLVESFDEAWEVTDDLLRHLSWEQDVDFLGWWWELGHLYRRWRWHRGYYK